jgi:chromosome segregation protein
MLRRLELVGFKSFADKTVFEFGDGITAVVGPNGSGKSNIVDAIRWILGEQSAKTLRGGEMADVIFNGSATRKSLGIAEVTMHFDNRKRTLPVDAEEVQISRRVYRTGEGEYLLNGQIARLKDHRDLFLGSGLGNDDLCIIAQGKVDVLLHSSTMERRTILEEAAGISRFKAKKQETLRKLERVDQNLNRAKDIVDEVEKQLKTVKAQASKAERYREHSDRLRELRVAVGIREFDESRGKLTAVETILEQFRTELDQRAARAVACEAEAERLEFFLADLDDTLRDQEGGLGRVLQQIKGHETTLGHEHSLSTDLDGELRESRRRATVLVGLVQELGRSVEAAAGELDQAEAHALDHRQAVHELETRLRSTASELARVQHQTATDQAEHLEMMRRAARLQNEAVAGKAQVDNLTRERQRLQNRSSQVAETLASVDHELDDLVAAEARLQEKLTARRHETASQREARDDERRNRDRLHEALSQLRQDRSALASRIDVLEGLLRSHEGLGVGVREVFRLLEQPEPGPWKTVLGMIADFLTVKREHAALIDLALGDWAQRFIVRDMAELRQALGEHPELFSGRVSFMPLRPSADESFPELADVQLSLVSRIRESTGAIAPDHPGLVAPAEQVVSCDHPELTDLPTLLLGRTFLVHDLAAARAIAERVPGLRLVTLDGALLEADGTLTVGRHHADAGLLSRKSELTDLESRLAELDLRLAATEAELAASRAALDRHERTLREGEEETAVLAEQTADLRGRVERHRERRQGLHEEATLQRSELDKIETDIERLDAAWQTAQAEAARAESQVQSLLDRLHGAEDEIRRLESDRQSQQLECTAGQVELAKIEERLGALRNRHRQLAHDHHDRHDELIASTQTMETAQRRLLESKQTMLDASAQLADGYGEKESLETRIRAMIDQRESRRHERVRLAQQAQTVRGEWRVQQEIFHRHELEANDLRHQSDGLIERLREDYQVDLAELHKAAAVVEPIEGDWRSLDVAAVQEEIAELKKKLARLGSVNLAALEEMAELETRAVDLKSQFDDLISAKRSLEEIIKKINQDSKRMFAETYTTVRTHFQELFRKLFGGGMADLVLEDEADILESGLEIIARPPGKELRSISLMSGGEKTLTAVALLLAVFRSKPAPFCLLDEVDAALDEANIGRFTSVLREFCDLSQFILVTHSKKTMACADVLYGITMQESGISKQIAIRFEDWVDPEEEKGVA